MNGDSGAILAGVVVNMGLWASIWYKLGRLEGAFKGHIKENPGVKDGSTNRRADERNRDSQ